MISLQNQELLTAAVQHVVQTRATAKQSAQQAAQQAALRPAAAGAKTATKKPKAATAKKAAKTAAAPAADQGITPYLTANDLMGLNDQQAAAETAISGAKLGITDAAANAFAASGNIERGRVADVSNANDDAAARGIYDSGIRQGNVGMANTNAARAQTAENTKLALATQQGYNQANGAKQQLTGYLQALAAKSAENGAALPVAPGNQNGATNVPGAKTVKKAAATKLKGTK